MRKYLFFAIAVLIAGLMNCDNKKETNCTDDLSCSWILMSVIQKGSITAYHNSGAVSGSSTYAVNVHQGSNCTGQIVGTANLGPSANSFNNFQNLSIGNYSLEADGNINFCSADISFSPISTLEICQVGASSFTCF